jgi:acetyl-CoA synthetase
MSEAQIAVHWKEEEKIHPSPKFVAQANLADQKSLERFSFENFPDFFEAYAELLDWSQRWQTTLDTSKAPFWKWFVGGSSTPATTASTGILRNTPTRRRSSSSPN